MGAKQNLCAAVFVFLEATCGNAQGLFLTLLSKITPSGFEGPYVIPGMEPW